MRTKTARFLGVCGTVAGVVAAVVTIGGCGSQKSSAPPPQSAVTPRPVAPPAPPQTIRNFVTPPYAEGIPYDDARAFGTAAVQDLISLLHEPSMADSRSNIVVTLGMIGGDPAEAELRSVIERGTGKQSQADFSVRLDAQLSLGYAANVATNTNTLTYLIAGLQSGVWDSRVSWQTPEGGVPFPRMRERTIIALGLSGKPQAKVALDDLLSSGRGGGRGGGQALTPSEQAVITEAIKVNQYLANHSLSQYFREYR
jgi:hypothetical protein